jgi:ubiquinone/menaquinone biosynthesis C-methylase UbiE
MNTASVLSRPQTGSSVEPFDSIAPIYDRIFTDSAIGRVQRAQVTTEINRRFKSGSRVLELNCGTGEDAIQMGRRGVEVSAFDASPSMIEVANRKLPVDSFAAGVSFGILRNEDLGLLEGSFDGALSNFAGMNCSSDWPEIAGQLTRLVKPGGHVLLCIMGRTCLWEMLYFFLRGEPRKALRRTSRYDVARIGSNSVDVHYLSVRDAKRAFSPGFSLCGWRGVGVFVPPSYCEPLFKTHNHLLRLLAVFDSWLGHMPGIRCFGDHVLLDFVRCAE